MAWHHGCECDVNYWLVVLPPCGQLWRQADSWPVQLMINGSFSMSTPIPKNLQKETPVKEVCERLCQENLCLETPAHNWKPCLPIHCSSSLAGAFNTGALLIQLATGVACSHKRKRYWFLLYVENTWRCWKDHEQNAPVLFPTQRREKKQWL